MRNIFFYVGFFILSQVGTSRPEMRSGFDWSGVEAWAIQDRGRIKPFDTFAQESVLFIMGKTRWNGMRAPEVIFSWLTGFQEDWEQEQFIRVDYKPLKEALGLEEKRQYFSPDEVKSATGLLTLLREASQKQQRKERLTTLDKKALELDNKRALLEAVVQGSALIILPNPQGMDEAWFPISALTDGGVLPYDTESKDRFALALRKMVDAFINNNKDEWNDAGIEVGSTLRQTLAEGKYPTPSEIQIEIHYNQFHPFRWAWILYTAALIFLIFGLVKGKVQINRLGLLFLVGGFVLHSYGFFLRCWIAGRPPVTNMYESVIWVTWGTVLFSLIIHWSYKNLMIPAASLVFAIAGLVLADNLPSVLDPGIHPLVPVLRSNFWLTIHVLCITLSYAAFAVATCLGNLNLGIYIFKPKKVELAQQNILFMYRAMQIGVVLLAAGTILGGVWADYSWGRFWGWDPKEVWALIALLFYIAVLHGRFTGWLKGFGFVAATVLSFLGVVMAWYGVNFVLGVGLHSYGFGSGGLSYVLTYLVAQIIWVVLSYYQFLKAGKPGNQYIAPRTGS